MAQDQDKPSPASDLTFCRLDDSQRPELIAKVGELLKGEGSHKAKIYDESLWRWQFEWLPTGITRLFAVLLDGEIAAYYHVQLYDGMALGKPCTIGITHDVAVLPALRGRRVFTDLVNYATDELKAEGVDLIYTLPNIRSFATYKKYSPYRHVKTFDVYLLPTRSVTLVKQKINFPLITPIGGWLADRYFRLKGPSLGGATAEILPDLTPEMVDVFADFTPSDLVHVSRSEAFLRWRYFRRPHTKYHAVGLREGGKLQAVVVVKQDEMFDMNGLLIMDFAHRKGQEQALCKLLVALRDRKKSGPLGSLIGDFLFVFGTSPHYNLLGTVGFMHVPLKRIPRPVNFFVYDNIQAPHAELGPDAFHFTLADWDPF